MVKSREPSCSLGRVVDGTAGPGLWSPVEKRGVSGRGWGEGGAGREQGGRLSDGFKFLVMSHADRHSSSSPKEKM